MIGPIFPEKGSDWDEALIWIVPEKLFPALAGGESSVAPVTAKKVIFPCVGFPSASVQLRVEPEKVMLESGTLLTAAVLLSKTTTGGPAT